jgi:hypothetical protein
MKRSGFYSLRCWGELSETGGRTNQACIGICCDMSNSEIIIDEEVFIAMDDR